ncbi:MAG: hypothetical protein NZ899_01615 [Thermoguttaceae bacterium]|nr:hypothetical protein [Thermoguttaceae bacterium]MDW8078633.1 hypothetical protein [Thermoguttaceae bacterium]
MAPLIVLGIPQGKLVPLPEALRLINVHSQAVLEAAVEESIKKFAENVDANISRVEGKVAEVYAVVVEDIEAKLEQMLGRWTELHQQVEKLGQQIKTSKDDVDRIEAVIRQLAPTWEQFVKTVLDFHLAISPRGLGLFEALREGVEEFETEKAKAELALKSAVEEIKTVDQHLAQATQQIDQLAQATSGSLKELEDKFKQFLAKRNSVSGRLTELEKAAAKLRDQEGLVRRELGRRLEHVAASFLDLEQRVEGLAKLLPTVARSQGEVSELSTQAQALNANHMELVKAQAKLQQEREAKRKEIHELQTSIKKLQAAKGALQLEITQLSRQVDPLEREVERLRKDLNELEERKQRVEQEVQEKKDEFARLAAKQENLKSAIAPLDREVNQLQLQREDLQRQCEALDADLRKKELEFRGLREGVEQLIPTLNSFKPKRQGSRSGAKGLSTRLGRCCYSWRSGLTLRKPTRRQSYSNRHTACALRLLSE